MSLLLFPLCPPEGVGRGPNCEEGKGEKEKGEKEEKEEGEKEEGGEEDPAPAGGMENA